MAANKTNTAATVAVIICGGSGSRLWPLSRQTLPKPFIALPSRAGTLIDDTYARLHGDELQLDAVITVTAADYAFLCERHFAASPLKELPHLIIAEPSARNTAPAIAVAAELAQRRFGDNTRIAIVSADQEMHNPATFRCVLQAAINNADNSDNSGITLVGIPPTYPATAYGYIEYEKDESQNAAANDDTAPAISKVKRFTEKPDLATAEQFLTQGNYYWNAGIFCFCVDNGKQLLAAHCPDISNALPHVFGDDVNNNSGATTATIHPAPAVYQRLPAISFDYAVMEKTQNTEVADGGQAGWRDVGSWNSVAELMPADNKQNRVDGASVHLTDCEQTLAISPHRLLVGIGLKNLHIVDTPDALLVADESQSHQLSHIFKTLLESGDAAMRTPTTVQKPWGSYTIIGSSGDEGERADNSTSIAGGIRYKIKRIDVAPGAQLSLQSHQHRSEHWTTILGTMTIVIDDKTFDMATNESCYIPQGAKHRMQNNSSKPAALIEVQIGTYLGEDDITRYDDIYGRTS